MSTQDPLNATQSLPDSPLEAGDIDSLSSPPKAIPSDANDKPLATPDGPFPPFGQSGNSKHSIRKKGKGRKKKGKKRKAGRSGKAVAAKPQAVMPIPDQAAEDKPLYVSDLDPDPKAGEEGVGRSGGDGIGLHPVTDKNVDQKEPTLETEPIAGVEDVLKGDPIEEVETRAAAYAKVKAVWEKAGDVCVRVYARPLNPRLILVEWEGEDGVEKHGKIVVGERQRGMFGPGKVVWVRGPLVGDRWLLAGKYNFLGNRVS